MCTVPGARPTHLINFDKVLANDLLAGVVHQHVKNSLEFTNVVLLYGLLAIL